MAVFPGRHLYGNKNGGIVTDGGGQHEGMPYGMAVDIFFPDVKDDAAAVQNTTGKHQHQHVCGHLCKKGAPAGQHAPAHYQVNDGGDRFPFSTTEDLEHGAEQGKRPEHHQQGRSITVLVVDEQQGGCTCRQSGSKC